MARSDSMGRDMDNTYAWRKANLKRYIFELNKVTDKDVYEHMEKQTNKRKYLIDLIRKDMESVR